MVVLVLFMQHWRDINYDYCIFGLPSGLLFLVGGASMVSACPLLPLGVGIPVVVDDVEGAESVGAVRSEGEREEIELFPAKNIHTAYITYDSL